LRSRLVPGEPCPVCGSRNHSDEHLATAVAEGLREQCAILTQRLQETDTALVQGRGDIAAAQAGSDAAAVIRNRATATVAAEQALYRDRGGALLRLASELPSTVELPGELSPQVSLARTLEVLEEDYQRTGEALAVIEAARQELQQAQAARHSLSRAIENRGQERRAINERLLATATSLSEKRARPPNFWREPDQSFAK
jgi:exonuclease SbcC